MTRFLIRFLGGFFAFVGLGALADTAVADGICDGVSLKNVSNGNIVKTSGVVSRALVTGVAWYVGWPNSEYSEMDYGPRTLWYDMDGYYDFFDNTDAFVGDWWQIPWVVTGELADSRLQNGCILAPDTDRICSNYYSDGKEMGVEGVFCAGCAISARYNDDTREIYDGMPGVLFAEVSGLFKDYGCCQYGETGLGILECPCFFASTDISGLTVTDMNGKDHDVPHVVPHIVTYNFLNCQADADQGVGENGHSYVLPWVSVSGSLGGTAAEIAEMLKGRVKFVFQPGFWNDTYYGASTDVFYALSDKCTFSDVYFDGIYGLSGAARCETSGCESASKSSGYWFNPRGCYSCRTLDDNYSSRSDAMEFYPTVDMVGAGTFLRSTFGRESCRLKRIGPYEDDSGSYEYSCDSYYKE